MAKSLFVEPPESDERILFPGAGTGCLAAAVQRFCSVRGHECPNAVAVDVNSDRLAVLEQHVSSTEPRTPPLSTRSKERLRTTYPKTSPSVDRPVVMDVDTKVGDFLLDPPSCEFDYIITNPPYTRYQALNSEKRSRYKREFESADGQFALFMPFIEQCQRLLADDGDLVFIAPVNYLLADYGTAFRKQLRRDGLEQFTQLPEEVFPHVQVETVVTALSSDPDPLKDGHFWLESFQYESVVDELLRDVGVVDEHRRQNAVQDYYWSSSRSEKILSSNQKRKGEDGGYNVSRIPPHARPGDSHQSELRRWSK